MGEMPLLDRIRDNEELNRAMAVIAKEREYLRYEHRPGCKCARHEILAAHDAILAAATKQQLSGKEPGA